jgi:hypothetical protein
MEVLHASPKCDPFSFSSKKQHPVHSKSVSTLKHQATPKIESLPSFSKDFRPSIGDKLDGLKIMVTEGPGEEERSAQKKLEESYDESDMTPVRSVGKHS